MAWFRNKKTGGWFEIPDEQLDTNKYMNNKIRNGISKVEFTQEELDAIDYFKEGYNGWGYQAIRLADINRLEEFGPIKEQLQKENESKANYIKENLQKTYKNFQSAVNKAPAYDNKEVYRYINSYNVPKINEEVKIDKYSSFTFKPNEKMTEQFGGQDKVVYRLQTDKDYKNIADLGNAITYESEVIVNNKKIYKVANVELKDFYGAKQYIVTLK